MIAVSRHFGALVAILLLAGAARAEVPADGTAKLEAAASDFRALVAGKKPGELPRFADDTDRKMLTAFWDADAIVGSPPYSARDIPALLEILGGLADLLRTYVFHAEPGKQADTISNEALYQDELVRTLAVLIRVNAAQMEAAADFFGDLPAED